MPHRSPAVFAAPQRGRGRVCCPGAGQGGGSAALGVCSPCAQARLGGGSGFALFTLRLWLWLEFVKGSG